jgi:hypothetical protein
MVADGSKERFKEERFVGRKIIFFPTSIRSGNHPGLVWHLFMKKEYQ